MLVLEDAQTSKSLARVAGFCPTSADFIDLVNVSIRRFLIRGDFKGTIVPIFVCVRRGCVVWPRYVGNVRALGTCHHSLTVRNIWGDYLQRDRCASWRTGFGGWHDARGMLTNTGRTSVFDDIQGPTRTVRAYARCQPDLGKTVTIFGVDDSTGQPLMTRDPGTGAWSLGQVLTLAAPFASTSSFVRKIDYVLKDETQCPVDLFAYNAVTNLLEPLATYEGSETRPSYERTRINFAHGWTMGQCSAQSCCGALHGVMALVKLQFIPAKNPTDLLLIDNLDAIAMMFQATKFREAGDRTNAKLFEADAVSELNRDLENESPEDQFQADNQIFANVTLSNHCF